MGISVQVLRQGSVLIKKPKKNNFFNAKSKVVTPSKRQSVGKQGGSGARSRSSSDERRNSAKSPPGSPSLHYQVSYTGEVLTVTILECKVSVSNECETCEQLHDAKKHLCSGFSNCVHSIYSLL